MSEDMYSELEENHIASCIILCDNEFKNGSDCIFNFDSENEYNKTLKWSDFIFDRYSRNKLSESAQKIASMIECCFKNDIKDMLVNCDVYKNENSLETYCYHTFRENIGNDIKSDINGIWDDKYFNEIENFSPDFVSISNITVEVPHFQSSNELSQICKNLLKSIKGSLEEPIINEQETISITYQNPLNNTCIFIVWMNCFFFLLILLCLISSKRRKRRKRKKNKSIQSKYHENIELTEIKSSKD